MSTQHFDFFTIAGYLSPYLSLDALKYTRISQSIVFVHLLNCQGVCDGISLHNTNLIMYVGDVNCYRLLSCVGSSWFVVKFSVCREDFTRGYSTPPKLRPRHSSCPFINNHVTSSPSTPRRLHRSLWRYCLVHNSNCRADVASVYVSCMPQSTNEEWRQTHSLCGEGYLQYEHTDDSLCWSDPLRRIVRILHYSHVFKRSVARWLWYTPTHTLFIFMVVPILPLTACCNTPGFFF